jgi:hypothetical protein
MPTSCLEKGTFIYFPPWNCVNTNLEEFMLKRTVIKKCMPHAQAHVGAHQEEEEWGQRSDVDG